MRILITGSSGQLGSALVETLSQEHAVSGLDRTPGPWTSQVGSLTDRELIFSLVKGVEAIIHTASLHARHLGSHSRTDFVQTNVQGTLNLLDAAEEMGTRRFIYTSTTSLYGKALEAEGRAIWVTEDLPPQPRDIYDVTKIAAEGLCQISAARSGLACSSLRVGRFFPEPARLLAVYRLYRGLDVRDAVQAHRLALESQIPGFEAFNISAHSPFTKDQVKELYQDAAGVIHQVYPWAEEAFRQRGWKLPERIDRVYVTEKAERLLGYRPVYNFENLF